MTTLNHSHGPIEDHVVSLADGGRFSQLAMPVHFEAVHASEPAAAVPAPAPAATNGDDVIVGTPGPDVLNGLGGNDTITGLGGADTLIGGPGNDLLDGGEGSDTASYVDAPSGVTVNLALAGPQDTVGAGIDTLTSIENLTGSDFVDTLTGDGGANVLTGGGGADVLQGGGGDDHLDGGAGADWASYVNAPAGVTVSLAKSGAQNTGGAGVDTLTGIEKLDGSAFNDDLTASDAGSTIYGEGGNDLLTSGAGNDYLNGGPGFDAVSYAAAKSGVTVSLLLTGAQNTGGAGTDTLVDIGKLVGSPHADVLTAGTFSSTLTGGAGGDDLIGGPGNDLLNGGGAADFADYALATAGVSVSLQSQDQAQDTIGAGVDTLIGIEKLNGSPFNDLLIGDSASNTIYGGAGVDSIVGAGGADLLFGGPGNDDFRFTNLSDSTIAAPDTVRDFAPGDFIDLEAIDANTSASGNNAFHLGATPGHAGDIVITFDAANDVTRLTLYDNSDAIPDGRILVSGDHSGFTASDFLL